MLLWPFFALPTVSLPSWLFQLESLTFLHLDHSSLEEFPPGFADYRLEILYMRDTESDLTSLANIPHSLRVLQLQGSKLPADQMGSICQLSVQVLSVNYRNID